MNTINKKITVNVNKVVVVSPQSYLSIAVYRLHLQIYNG